MRHALVLFASLVLPALASASSVFGNPTAPVVLIDDAEVYVDRIVAVECTTTVQDSFDIDTTLEQWDNAQYTLDVDDDYCQLFVHVRWTPSDPIEEVTVEGFDTLTIQANAQAVEIELHAASRSAALVQ